MSRLDQHVAMVRFRLMLATFIRSLPWAGTIFAVILVGVLVAEHVSTWEISHGRLWLWIGIGVTTAFSLAFAIVRRPSARQAAVAIDERLGFNEKFSTALYVRSSNDPFAAAAVRDAEKVAASADLRNRFPIPFPGRWTAWLVLAVGIAIVTTFLPHYNFFAATPAQATIAPFHAVPRAQAEQLARQVIAEAESAPREVAENEQVKMAVGELQKAVEQHAGDPARTQTKAQDLLKDIAAIKEKIAETNKFVTENNEMKALQDISAPSPEETGPVADAQRALADKNVDKAVDELKKAVNNFDKMDKKEQEKNAEQMEKLAQQMQQKAKDPKVQEQVQKKLEEAGVDKEQAKKMSDLMKAAANGDQQAAKQLQQMANQAAQQLNQQAGMPQAQQKAVAQAIKDAVNQGQQKTNQQAGAQQMAKTTQSLANAMKQAAGQNQKQNGQGQGQQPQQANAGQKNGGQQGQQQGKQPGQGQNQQAQAQQGGQQGGQGQGQKQQGQAQAGQQAGQGQGQQQAQAQQGGQQAGQGQGQGQGQNMQQLQQQMQQQVAQLGAMAKDQQGVAAAQQAQQGQGQQGQGQQGQGQGQGQQANGQWGQGQGQGQGQQNQPNQQGQQGQGQGQGGVGVGGRRPDPEMAPFDVKKEYSESHTIEDGKIIAESFVKAPSDRGTSKMKMGQAIDSESKADAGEVEPDRIPRSAQKAVKDYFDTLKQDGK